MFRIQTAPAQPVHRPPGKLRCRFEMSAADTPFSHEFCVFDLPGCEGCPKAEYAFKSAERLEDPMTSNAWNGWFALASPK